MPLAWLTVLAWVALAVAVVSAVETAYDLFGRGYRQKMPVMAAVWPVTVLYFGPAASWAYRRFGRPKSQRWQRERAAGHAEVGGGGHRGESLRRRLHAW